MIHQKITAAAESAAAAIRSLVEIAEHSPELVQGLLQRAQGSFHPVRIYVDENAASNASDLRIRLEPSEFLGTFLAAPGAGNID